MNHSHRTVFSLARPAISLFSFFVISLAPAHALDNGLARTPPMGWNSWNIFREEGINEALFKQIADKLVSSGMAKLGYVYVCIDNGWYVGTSANQYDATKFPNGIKPLADYVHGLGLKLGIYTNWESRNKETRDVNAWASWGIDYVKHDSWKQYSTETAIWTTMRDAILATGRPMVYSVHFQDRKQVIGNPKMFNMWRFTNDLIPFYNRANQPGIPSWGFTTVEIIEEMARIAPTTGPGCWADADMLMVGLGKQTLDEWKTSFAISCVLPSPLIVSADIRSSPKEIMDIFLNEELIAVNQDTLGSKSWKVRDNGLRDVWARRLGDSSFAVVFFNMDVAATMQVSWSELQNEGGKALVRDLWQQQNVGSFSNGYAVAVPTHGAAFLKITPERFLTQVRMGGKMPAGALQPEVIVRPGDGVILVSLKQFPVAPLRVRYTLSTLAGKKISTRNWSIEPGAGGENSLKVPSGLRTGTYVVSLMAENTSLKLHKEIQTKVFIKR